MDSSTNMDTEAIIKQLQSDVASLQQAIQSPVFPDHFHNGYDYSPINFQSIYQKKLWVHTSVPGTSAATATNYGVFWIAPMACSVSQVWEVHQTLGTDGGAVTVNLEKLSGTTAPDSGSTILATAFSLKATINTVQTGTLVTTQATKTLAKGDRLCLKDSGVLTAVAGVTLLIEITII